jgi:hypothetical protein
MADKDKFKVVVVVDVQNCFMYTSDEQNAHFLNLGFKSNTSDASKDVAKEISTLIAEKVQPNAVVFTRDFHPINHISFDEEGREKNLGNGDIWPRHCRNRSVACKPRNFGETIPDTSKPKPPIELSTLTSAPYNLNMNKIVSNMKGTLHETEVPTLKVYGTDISYYFYETTPFLAKAVYKLNYENKLGRFKIGLKSTTIENNELQTTDGNDNDDVNHNIKAFADIGDNIKYISLTKGEKCNQESYSAFNYHVVYNPETPETPVKTTLPPAKKHSTGLWEWILTNKGTAKNIEITVCGLVGNVCVMFSVVQGMAMWDLVYKPENLDVNVTFTYSYMGNRFTIAIPPRNVQPPSTHDFNWDSIIDSVTGPRFKYYYSNIPEEWFEFENKFKVIDYNGDYIGEHSIPKYTAGGKRRSRRMRSVCRRHRLDLNGVCKICSKYCKKSRRRRHRKNKKSRKY